MKRLIKLFRKHNGFLRSKELQKNGYLYSQLKELVEKGIVEKIKPGIYRHTEYAKVNEFVEVCKIYPQAVLCLYSAWSYYNLTTHIPAEYHLAIPNKKKIKTIDYPPVQLYYWSIPYFEIEIIEKNGIRIYSLEKTVCDAIRFKHKTGTDILSEVLKSYLKRKDKNLDKLLQVAKKLKIEQQVRNIVELLL